jgi:hypothetical protein
MLCLAPQRPNHRLGAGLGVGTDHAQITVSANLKRIQHLARPQVLGRLLE